MLALFIAVPALVALLCFLLVGRTGLHMAVKTPLILLGSFAAISSVVIALGVGYLFSTKTPTLDALTQSFTERRPVLEQIGRMAHANREFSRLNRAYVTLAATGKTESTRSALIADRWEQYKQLFARAGLRDGFEQDTAGNIFFIAGGEGLIHRGHATGYVFCADPGTPASAHSPFVSCRLAHQATGSQKYDVMKNAGGYEFRQLADHWFVFDQDHS